MSLIEPKRLCKKNIKKLRVSRLIVSEKIYSSCEHTVHWICVNNQSFFFLLFQMSNERQSFMCGFDRSKCIRIEFLAINYFVFISKFSTKMMLGATIAEVRIFSQVHVILASFWPKNCVQRTVIHNKHSRFFNLLRNSDLKNPVFPYNDRLNRIGQVQHTYQ